MSEARITVRGMGAAFPWGTGRQRLQAEYRSAHAGAASSVGIPAPSEEARAKVARWLDPVAKNAIAAVGDALRDADVPPDAIGADAFAYGIVSGSKYGPVTTRERGCEALARRRVASATFFSHSGYNMAAAMAAVAYHCRGPNLTLSASVNLGAVVARRAVRLLAKGGRPHTLLAGFSEAFVTAAPPEARRAASGPPSIAEAAAYVCLSNASAPSAQDSCAELEVLSRDAIAEATSPLALLLRPHWNRFAESTGDVLEPSLAAPEGGWRPWPPCAFGFDPDYLFILQLGIAARELTERAIPMLVLPERLGNDVYLFVLHAGGSARPG